MAPTTRRSWKTQEDREVIEIETKTPKNRWAQRAPNGRFLKKIKVEPESDHVEVNPPEIQVLCTVVKTEEMVLDAPQNDEQRLDMNANAEIEMNPEVVAAGGEHDDAQVEPNEERIDGNIEQNEEYFQIHTIHLDGSSVVTRFHAREEKVGTVLSALTNDFNSKLNEKDKTNQLLILHTTNLQQTVINQQAEIARLNQAVIERDDQISRMTAYPLDLNLFQRIRQVIPQGPTPVEEVAYVAANGQFFI